MGKQTILVVDDTPENIDILVGILKSDYKIRVATSGEAALKLAKKQPTPDLVLLDIMMPGIDGYQVCEQLRFDIRTSHIPVIFVSAKMTVEDEIKGLQTGAVDYITKPISPPVVQQRVKTHLALSDQSRELSERVAQQTAELRHTRYQIIQRLGKAAEYKDNETGMHVARVAHYCHLLAIKSGLSEYKAEQIKEAATMHDIGKIGIPDHILRKPGRLNEDEFNEMKKHSLIGGEIIGDTEGSELLKLAKQVALTHHEKWNGAGYPKGLAGSDIPLAGRIVAIADVFDALTSERPYKKIWSIEKARALIRDEAGTHFDPYLVQLFEENIDEVLAIKQRFMD